MSSEDNEYATAEVDLSFRSLSVAGGVGIAAAIARGVSSLRDRLPEPFDIVDHIGNLNGSVPAGAFVGWIAGEMYASGAKAQPESTLRIKTRAIMALGGLAAGVAVNLVSETKLGMSIIHMGDDGNVTDFAYGVASSIVAASAAPTLTITTESNSGDISQ